MNFFEQQNSAKKRSRLLITLFLLGTIGICALVSYVCGAIALYYSSRGDAGLSLFNVLQNAPSKLLLVSFFTTFAVIVLESLSKISILSNNGGKTIALSLGGRYLNKNTVAIEERILLNVVDEISIASGIPSPPVYLLDKDNTINAFAAGMTYDDAVIGVTKGAIDYLNRDELQGVIAHEFSHIFNGDMKLNIRAIGILHGILFISLVGEFLMRSFSKGNNKNGGVFVLAGFALYITGYIGLFFGSLTKAAINRQREYLADASAVQFTRHPRGLANALKKIGGVGSFISSVKADEFSHLYFSSGVKNLFSFSTHPPLEKRIRALEPSWNGKVIVPKLIKHKEKKHMQEGNEKTLKFATTTAAILNNVDNIGTLNPQKLDDAAQKIEHIPQILRECTTHPILAQLIIFSMLLDTNKTIKKIQENIIENEFYQNTSENFHAIKNAVSELDKEANLNLINLSMATLKSITKEQYFLFRSLVNRLIEADKSVSWFELNLKYLVLYPLDISFGLQNIPAEVYSNLTPINLEISTLLSAIACSQFDDEQSAQDAFNKMADIADAKTLKYVPLQNISLPLLENAYYTAQKCKPILRRKIFEIAIGLLKSNGKINAKDLETVHALAALLHLPISI
ncbi:MAG: M48 family metallopeptidase [Campylobacteraceae bacterium]|jgi:Zn-dependent protease with chaperone function|nr:M48 family metallopeptidase [Campylobacteraceae bacterium]